MSKAMPVPLKKRLKNKRIFFNTAPPIFKNNILCISSFGICKVGTKDSPITADDLSSGYSTAAAAEAPTSMPQALPSSVIVRTQA